MKVIYSLFGKPRPFFNTVVACSRKFANVPVEVMEHISDDQSRMFNELRGITNSPYELDAAALMRWFVIYEAAKTWGKDQWPILTVDWDMLVCGDLRPMFELINSDVCFTEDNHGERGPAYVIRSIEPLKAFCDLLCSMLEASDPILKTTNDMSFWHLVVKRFGIKTEAINDLPNGDVMDHNLVCGEGRYEMVPSGLHPMWNTPLRKKIVYHEGRPYFVDLKGQRVRPLVLHFWGPLKDFAVEVGSKLLCYHE